MHRSIIGFVCQSICCANAKELAETLPAVGHFSSSIVSNYHFIVKALQLIYATSNKSFSQFSNGFFVYSAALAEVAKVTLYSISWFDHPLEDWLICCLFNRLIPTDLRLKYLLTCFRTQTVLQTMQQQQRIRRRRRGRREENMQKAKDSFFDSLAQPQQTRFFSAP